MKLEPLAKVEEESGEAVEGGPEEMAAKRVRFEDCGHDHVQATKVEILEHTRYVREALPCLTATPASLGMGLEFIGLTEISDSAVFASYLQTLSEKVDDLLDSAPDELRADLDTFIETLVQARARRERHAYVSSSSSQGRRLLAEMRESNGGSTCYIVEPTPRDRADDRWTKGKNRAKKESRTWRTLMPLHFCLDILKNVDCDYFLDRGGFRCHWNALERPNTAVYLLLASEVKELNWGLLGREHVEIRSFELALDYSRDMTRLHVQQPKQGMLTPGHPREMLVKRFADQWAEILLAYKKVHMNVEEDSAWPPKSHLPWIPESLEDMPVVVWLRTQKFDQ